MWNLDALSSSPFLVRIEPWAGVADTYLTLPGANGKTRDSKLAAGETFQNQICDYREVRLKCQQKLLSAFARGKERNSSPWFKPK